MSEVSFKNGRRVRRESIVVKKDVGIVLRGLIMDNGFFFWKVFKVENYYHMMKRLVCFLFLVMLMFSVGFVFAQDDVNPEDNFLVDDERVIDSESESGGDSGGGDGGGGGDSGEIVGLLEM